VNVAVERSVEVSASPRARQLEGLFDVPHATSQTLRWDGEVDFDAHPWHLGLVVGPSGAGKSTLVRELFGEHVGLDWTGASVVDDFAERLSMADIAAVCQAVGFNTIPAWLRPYRVLSTGEQFRVDLARRMLELGDPIVVDEFTSVVDRQVAKVGSYAVAKYVRRHDRRLVAATCHLDVIDWLQPDWTFEPATMTLTWRSLQPRPPIECVIGAVPHARWRLFAPYHYLTAELHKGARCFMLWANGQPAAFTGLMVMPHPTVKNLMRISRTVTLPDWQGLGLSFVLNDALGGAYKRRGWRVRNYPAHPAFMRAHDRSPNWALTQKPLAGTTNPHTTLPRRDDGTPVWRQGSRPNAVFEYVGDALSAEETQRLFAAGGPKSPRAPVGRTRAPVVLGARRRAARRSPRR
jgi:predicted ABC-type transport system involved in lysophospholipase L1 biosynthesis ATPase subunit